MRRQGLQRPGSGRVCNQCGQPGHIASNCPTVRCHRCGRLGHIARNCHVSHSPQRMQSSGCIQMSPGASTSQPQGQGTSQPQSRTPVEEATQLWRQSVRDWYPNLHTQTYFLPPLHFNRVPYDVQTVADHTVLVPQVPSDQPNQAPLNPVPSGPPPPANPLPLASLLIPDQPVPAGPLPRVQASDVTDDRAMQQVLQCIRYVAESRQEVMMVLSQLQFRKYLDNQVDPITAAATLLLPHPATPGCTDGDFDVLIISRRYGLIVGEVKSVGADPHYTTDRAVVAKVQKAVQQLEKCQDVLKHLVSDLAPVNVTKTLMLPNITSQQVLQALSTNPQAMQDLCQCVGATDIAAAVARCLCADSLTSSVWWERSVTDHGQDTNMTDDLYETLVARFCGPASSIEVPTVTTPRRRVELRTLSQAIAHTGLTMAILTLLPAQLDVVNDPGLQRVFLWGPPGTGKTVVLVIKGLQWRHQGKDVHLMSPYRHSRAAILLIEHQLLHAPGVGSTATAAAAPRVHRHMYDFEKNEGDVMAAVRDLEGAARDGDIRLLVDEAGCGYPLVTTGRLAEFCDHLAARVPALHLWAAAVWRDNVPACVSEVQLTAPVRCPPAVVRKVAQCGWIDDKHVPRYSSNAIPAPTDGPAVRTLRHATLSVGRIKTLLPGHTGYNPRDCAGCADAIAGILVELGVGQPDQHLQYRDTIILCDRPRDDLPVIISLSARGLPVQVVTESDDEAAIRDVALAVRDVVIVTDSSVVTGLERRIVVVVEGWRDDTDSLDLMSRSTSLVVYVGSVWPETDDARCMLQLSYDDWIFNL